MPLLTFAIPTYNRAEKLMRLLGQLETELSDAVVSAEVEVLVSDNCSADATGRLAGTYVPRNFKLKYVRQPQNLGFDGNIDFLYNSSSTDYVWFFSDDDILLPGAFSRIIDALKSSRPDALLFSFQQPLGSAFKHFTGKEPVYEVSSPAEIIEHLGRCTKISIYVLRTVRFSEPQLAELAAFRENGFYFVDLAFSVVAASGAPKLCVIPAHLAACDAEYLKDVFDPGVIKDGFGVYAHPYVLSNTPKTIKAKEIVYYRAFIDFLFAYKTGLLTARNPDAYEKGISSINFRTDAMLSSPKILLKYILLRTRMAGIFRYFRNQHP